MSEALFILIGLVVVGAVIWAGSRRPPDTSAGPEDNPYAITDPSRTLFTSDHNPIRDTDTDTDDGGSDVGDGSDSGGGDGGSD